MGEISVKKSNIVEFLMAAFLVCGLRWLFGFEATMLIALIFIMARGIAVKAAGQDEYRWKF